jgi:hypothetical protein
MPGAMREFNDKQIEFSASQRLFQGQFGTGITN